MAVALLGKCVALLGLIVLLYATCYGFRIRDITPQTHHPTVCVPTHGRACPADKTVTTGGPIYSARKWHESTVPRTIAGGRKPPGESTSDVGTDRIRIEKITEHSRDRDTTGPTPRGSKIEIDEMDDDKEEEEIVEVEDVEEDEESVGDSKRDQTDRKADEDEEEEEETSEAELSDQDAKDKEKKVKRKFFTDNDDESEDNNDDKDEDEDKDEDKNEDEVDNKKTFKRDSKKQVAEVKTAKIVKSMKYSKSKADDDDDDDDKEEEDKSKEEEKKTAKTDQQKAIESLKKQLGVPHKKQEKDKDDKNENEDKEPDVKETISISRKLEKVRLADKDKRTTKLLPSKPDMEKPKQEDKRLPNVAKPVVENVKKTIESTKKIESIESTKESVDSTKKSVESAKKLTEDTKKVESIKAAPKPKAESVTKVDEKSTMRVKPETSTPASKIKEQAKQAEKADVKKVAAKPTSKPSKEVSQAESEYYVKTVRYEKRVYTKIFSVPA